MRKVIKNETKGGKHILTLAGTVGGDSFFDEEFISAKDVRDSLHEVTDDIIVKLNSPGGDVFAGVEIYNYLAGLKNNVTIEVIGTAASAASLIAMAGDKVIMRTGSTMMIHEASTFAYGTKADIQKTLNALATIDDSIISIYAERTGIATDAIKTMLQEETWLSADEAVEKGFADEKSSLKAEKKKDDKKKVKNIIKFAAHVVDEDEEEGQETFEEQVLRRLDELESDVADLKKENKEQEEEPAEDEPVENNSNWLFF